MANFALEGPKWGSSSNYGSTGGQVTWSFATYNYAGQAYEFDNSIGDTTQQAAIRDAFAKWESVCSIDFVEVTDTASVAIRLGLDAIDGPYNTVGQCYYTYTSDNLMSSSEIRFDTAESFDYAYLYEVALHEIGHAIGFDHYEGSASIMNAVTGDATDLTAGDIQGAVYVYGSPVGGGTVYPGGPGDNTYVVNFASDVVNEAIGQGYDTILASVSYTLKAGQSIEVLATTNASGAGAINLAGNDLAQTIQGNAGTNVLFGYGGNDILNGGTGMDSMRGGLGDDTYYVDNASDALIEAAGQGTDTVLTTVSYGLAAAAEIEALLTSSVGGTAAINLAGNDFAQTVRGNAGANILNGQGGNDVLIGNAGNDTLVGGAGADAMQGGLGNDSYTAENVGDRAIEATGQGTDTVLASVSFALGSGTEVEALVTSTVGGTAAINLAGNEFAQTIRGNAGANLLTGNGGNDALIGGAGADTMRGGLGDDSFAVDNAGDVVVEAAGEGTDTVRASVSYALSTDAAVELLTTAVQAGTAAINLNGSSIQQAIYGNEGINFLVGNGGNDVLNGFGGNDRLYGGTGIDTLTGGAGSDLFVFNAALNATTNVDAITDFNVAADTIWLENAVFTALTATGVLVVGAFMANATGLATQADDRVIYETDTGKLFYDSNGSGAGGATQFAQLTANLALTNNDFAVI